MPESPDSQRNDPIIWDITPQGEETSEERSSADTSTTPASELSPPGSPTTRSSSLSSKVDGRAKARALAASLSLEEQVRGIYTQCPMAILTRSRCHSWSQQIFGDQNQYHQKEYRLLRLLMDPTGRVAVYLQTERKSVTEFLL